jgi:hypothetical protein
MKLTQEFSYLIVTTILVCATLISADLAPGVGELSSLGAGKNCVGLPSLGTPTVTLVVNIFRK